VSPSEAPNIGVVRRYFDGCNSSDIDDLMGTLAPDVSHYFLPSTFPPIKGAVHLAKYWRKYKRALDPTWAIDCIVAQEDEVVSEWSCIWHAPGIRKRSMARGSEWCVMRDARILEARAYFIASPDTSIEVASFPYAERGYLL